MSILDSRGAPFNLPTLLDVAKICALRGMEILPILERLNLANMVNPPVLMRRVSRLVDQHGYKIYLEDK